MDQFFDMSNELLCIADFNGYFRRLNQMWEALLGYAPQEMEGRLFLDFVHPDDVGATLQAVEAMSAKKPIINFINRYRHQDGSYRVLEWRAHAADGLMYGVARDITDRVEMERALMASEARYRSLVDNLSEGVVYHDRTGVILACNQSAERILGLTCEQMNGRTSVDKRWRAIYPDGRPMHGEDHPAMVTLRTAKPVKNVVMGVYKPDGDLTWILVNTQPVLMPPNDALTGVVASFADITDLKLATDRMSQMEREREHAQLLSAFIANTSHELRTPLTIIGSSTYLLTRTIDPGKRSEKAEQIGAQIRLLDRMITQLQDMATLNHLDGIAMHRIYFWDVVKTFASDYQPARQSVRLEIDVLPDGLAVMGDAGLLGRAVWHVVENAVRHSPEGGVVRLSGERSDSEARVHITDEGVGIEPQHLPLIFEAFYKADESRTQGASAAGMGLTMVKRIMDLHGGRVEVNSSAGHTRFTLSLPLALLA
jgi:PAS domain S-box-containing protein